MIRNKHLGAEIFVASIVSVCCYLYFNFVGPIEQYGANRLWSRPANINDYLVYFNWAKYKSIWSLTAGDNNFGISWIYLNLVDRYNQFHIFIFNMLFLFVGLHFYNKICRLFQLNSLSYFCFLTNTFLLYFSLLINKDMATFCILMASAYFAVQRKPLVYLCLIPLAFLVRQQLALFIVLLFFLESRYLTYKLRVIIVFVVGSIAGIIALQMLDFIDESTLGEGLTGRLSAFFLRQRWLAPLGVPIRLLLYIFDYFSGIAPFEHGQIDAFRALRIPSIVFFVAAVPFVVRAIANRLRYVSFSAYRPIVSTCIAFMSALLINPQINARYLTSLVPLLMLLTMIVAKKVPYRQYLDRLAYRQQLSANGAQS